MAARSVETWARANLIVPDGPRAGEPFRVRKPPWREVLAAMASPQLEQVSCLASVQSGKTAALIASSLFHLAHGRSALFYEPSDKLTRAMARRVTDWGKRSTDEALRAAFSNQRQTLVREHESGGRIEFLNAGERTAGLSRTARVVVCDELRAFPGHFLQEITDRMASYGGRGLLVTASSAGLKGECLTSAELAKSDHRRWFLPCPSCGQRHVAQWESVRWKGRKSPVYITPCCKSELDSRALAAAVNRGEWRVTAKPTVPRTRGYSLSALDGSPFESLATLHRAWTRATEHRKTTGSISEQMAFVQGRLARVWDPQGDSGVTPDKVMAHCRADYDPTVLPAGAAVVVVAADTQDDRLEASMFAFGVEPVERAEDATELRGWDEPEPRSFSGLEWGGQFYRLRMWALSHHVLRGDPAQPHVWEALREIAERRIPHALGPPLRACMVAIDSGGHYTPQVAEFCRVQGDGYQAVKGNPATRHDGPMFRLSQTEDSVESYGPAGLGLVNTAAAKASIFSVLRSQIAGGHPQFLWPMDESTFGAGEYDSLCSEVLTRIVDRRTGQTRTLWKKVQKANEVLDTTVYALAAASWLGVGYILQQHRAIQRSAA